MRKTATAILAVMLMAISVSAAAAECQTSSFTRSAGLGSIIQQVETGPNDGTVKTAVVGSFFWLGDMDENPLSVPVPDDAVGVTACPNGDITFDIATPEPEPAPEAAGEPESDDTATETVNVFEEYEDLLTDILGALSVFG